MSGDSGGGSFWTTLPGLLGGLAALLTAVFAGYAVFKDSPTTGADAGTGPPPAERIVSGRPAPDCTVGGTWIISHGNGAQATMKMRQSSGALVGSGREGGNSGALQGSITGRDVEFSIDWSNGHTGVYQGSIRPDGGIIGQNYDKADPTSQAGWSVEQGSARCS